MSTRTLSWGVRSASRPHFLLDGDMVSFLSMEAVRTAPRTGQKARDVDAGQVVAVREGRRGPRGAVHFVISVLRAGAFAAQNIPFGLARGMFGPSSGAEFFGSPTSCNVSQCSTALPSAFIR